ncbi:hypothetical protein vseg_002224 [Gypsophila vaccaria]
MRTRRGVCYPKLINSSPTTPSPSPSPSPMSFSDHIFKNCCRGAYEQQAAPKRPRISQQQDFFEALPDDIVVSVLAKLSASASCPADLITLLFTCKRLKGLARSSMVLSRASPKTFAIKASKWSDSAHKFLKLCSDSGNVEASYTLGMIRFYCLHNRGSGASMMAKAAINSHAQALYSLAVIQFNGSGGTKTDKDLRAGVALCARAAFLGHVDALRELGHCLQDGYGVRQNIAEGRRFLIQANARELALSLTCSSPPPPPHHHLVNNNNNNNDDNGFSNVCEQGARVSVGVGVGVGCPLLSDFGCNVPGQEAHPASRFMSEWYAGRAVGPGLRVCSHAGCGRPETRKHEFRRCSVCGTVNYCSRACQALDWKVRHKVECTPMPRWAHGGGGGGAGVDVDGNGNGGVAGMEVDNEVDGNGDS